MAFPCARGGASAQGGGGWILDGFSKQHGNERERLVGVQYLRAVACLEIVLYHSGGWGGYFIFLGGFGVPLFFVISGFIMVTITDAGSRPGPFLRNRIGRIVPLYWLATTAAALLGGMLGAKHLLASYLFLPWPRPGADIHYFPVLGVGWTLNYEMFFYGLFALSLFAPACYRLAVLTAAFAALAAAGFVLGPSPGVAGFWTNPIILLFLAGVWVGHWWWRRDALLLPLVGGAVALALALASALRHFQAAGMMTILCVLMLVATLAAERAGAFRRPMRWLRILGDASYSIYLWHVLVLIVLAVANRTVQAPNWVFVVLGAPLGIAVGVLSYFALERPLLRHFRARRRPATEVCFDRHAHRLGPPA